MAVRTKAEIQRDIKGWLESRVRVVDTGSATALSALLLEGLVTALVNANNELSKVQTAQGLGNPSSVPNSDLDELAYNFSLARRSAVRATGFITFRRTTAPDQTIRIGNQDGSGGVIVTTGRDANGAFVSFVTTSTAFFTTSATKDPVSGLYEVSAPIQCLQAGSVGNKAAGTATILQSPVAGVTSVTNKISTTGGKDAEDNTSLALRIASRMRGFQVGIQEGLRSIALGTPGVEDAAVIGPDDIEFQRSTIGAIDLVIKGQALATRIDTLKFTAPTPILLENRPVSDVASVVSTVGLTQVSLTKGSQWQFSQDAVTEERRSVKSNDHVSWLGTSAPNANADVIVTYTQDRLVRDLQDTFDLPSKHFPSADVLVKSALSVTIDIAFTVQQTSGVDSTTLRDRTSTALSDFIATLGLNSTVKQSELVSKIKAVSGVKRVTVPFTKLAKRGSSGVADIALTKYEYPQLDASSLTITVTA